MPHPMGYDLPPPEFWQEFETLCKDVMEAKLRAQVTGSLHGRPGQGQKGVDFVVQLDAGLFGYQCKRVSAFTPDELREEVEEAKKFRPAIRAYTVLTSLPGDAPLQQAAYEISEEHRASGLFRVEVVSWTTLRDWLVEFPEVLKKHYPDLAPDFIDQFRGWQRRLQEDHPGSMVEMRINPGPDGISFSVELRGAQAIQRWREARSRGTPVEFDASEANVVLPKAIADFHAGMALSKFAFRPSMAGRPLRVRLLIHPRSRHHTFGMFARRAPKDPSAIAAQGTFHRIGSEETEMSVWPDLLPLHFRFVTALDGEKARGTLTFDRLYQGANPSSALRAEELLLMLEKGGYFAVFGDRIDLVGDLDNPPEGLGDGALRAVLEMLAELEDLSGWELILPEKLEWSEVGAAAELLETFKGCRIPFTGDSTITVGIAPGIPIDEVQRGMEGAEPWSIMLREEPKTIRLFGQAVLLPAVRVTVRGAKAQVAIQGDGGHEIRLTGNDSADVHFALDGSSEE